MNPEYTSTEILPFEDFADGDRPEFCRLPSPGSPCPKTALMANSLYELIRPGKDGSAPKVRSFPLKINPEQKRACRLIWYPSLLGYLYGKDICEIKTPSVRPEFIRVVQSPKRCPWSGLSHSTLFNLILPNERNGFKPPVQSVSLRKRGASKGTRLVVLDSLLGYLHEQMEAHHDEWDWGKQCISMNRASGRPRKQRSP